MNMSRGVGQMAIGFVVENKVHDCRLAALAGPELFKGRSPKQEWDNDRSKS